MANPKKGTSQARNEFIWGWAFILPTMLGLIILNIYPIFKTIYESFFKTGDFGKGNIFIGFDNYVKLFHDAEVWQALLNTFKYAIVEVPFSIAIALVLAVLLNRKMKGRAVYRTIFFLPMVAAPAAIAMVWRWLFNSEFGLLNHIFHTKINWISDPKIAVYAIAVIGVWSIIGYNMVLFLSGLQEIPSHSACVTRQTHTSRYVLSISSNAAKRRFKDKRFTSCFIITTSIKKCNIFLQKNSRHLWRLRSDSELLIISHLRLP